MKTQFLRPAFVVLSLVGVALPLTVERPAHAEPKHQLFFEAGGPAVLDSVNYELQPTTGLALRVGHGVAPVCWSKSCTALMITPVGVSYFGGTGSHHYEVGASASVAWTSDSDARFVSPSLGYRYQRPEGGLTVRVSATPLIRMNKPSDVLPWAGASVGYTF